MPSAGFIAPDLDPEVEDLLAQLADMAAEVPRAQQQFLVSQPLSSRAVARVTCANNTVEAAPQDLKALKQGGLIDTTGPIRISSGSYTFHLTRNGTVIADKIRQRGEPLEKIEDETVRYIEEAAFRARYPEATQKWAHAARLLAEDPIGNTTRIGHDCREALAAFASVLVERHRVREFDAGRGTVDSIRDVIEHYRHEMGARTSDFLQALVAYWGTVSDLAQRQEHAAHREGEQLTATDGRRALWYSALVMYECDVTFG